MKSTIVSVRLMASFLLLGLFVPLSSQTV